MANKYLRHGETYCGDGTTSAAAASAGAAGAWNNINVLAGTAPAFGALATGDVVYIRSKDNAGANISVSVSADLYLGSSACTTNATRITWVLDNGAVWSGIDGTLTYLINGDYRVYFRQYNTIHAKTQDALILRINYASYWSIFSRFAEAVIASNIWFDCSTTTITGNGPYPLYFDSISTPVTLINPRITLANKLDGDVFTMTPYSCAHITSPRIDFLAAISTARNVFNMNTGVGSLFVYGGAVTGSIGNVTLVSSSRNSAGVCLQGLRYPVAMGLVAPSTDTDPIVYAHGCDASGLGVVMSRTGGFIDSRQDGFYPSLSAYYPTLAGHYPDSLDTQWAWRMHPKTTSLTYKLEIPFNKLWTGAAATKTVTCEMLISHAFTTAASATKGRVWLEVFYVDDATGSMKTLSSADFGSTTVLDTSSATWSSTTYAATLYDAVKIALTTPTSIKQDTLLTALLCWSVQSPTALDYVFVDSELALT